MGTLAAWKPPPKQQTTSKPPEVPQGNIEDSTHLFLYLIEAQLLENLVKMSTAGLPTPSSLLSSLLPFATAAGGHSKTAAKSRGWGGRWLEEPRVNSKISLFYVFNRGSVM